MRMSSTRRPILCILAVSIVFLTEAKSQWTQIQCPANVGNLWCIDFTPAGPTYSPMGYIGSDRGMLRSLNDGNWLYTEPESYAVHGFAFMYPSMGTAACNGGRLLVTHVSGITWVESNVGQVPWVDFQAVSRPDLYNAFAVGSFGRIAKSTDGGNNWTSTTLSGYNGTFHQLHFFNASNGVIVGDGGKLVRRTDGGWLDIPSGTSSTLRDLHFPTATIGYITGDGGVLLKTTDAGYTWQPLQSPTEENLYAVHFESEMAGFIAGAGGKLWGTEDGGANWVLEVVDGIMPDDRINAINVHEDSYYAVGDHGLIATRQLLVGIAEPWPDAMGMRIMPNPANNLVHLTFPNMAPEPLQVDILNASGQCVLSVVPDRSGQGMDVPVGDLSAGPYVCRVRYAHGLVSAGFIKE